MLTLLETLPPPPKPPISVDKKRLMKRIPLNKKRNRVIKDPIMVSELIISWRRRRN